VPSAKKLGEWVGVSKVILFGIWHSCEPCIPSKFSASSTS
jgi:hypothetical protein